MLKTRPVGWCLGNNKRTLLWLHLRSLITEHVI